MEGKDAGHEGTFTEFKEDWNADQLYAMHLKVAEQAVYGLQFQLEDLERVAGRYNTSNLMRVAYILKRLEKWYEEMCDFYEYSHKPYPKPGSFTQFWSAAIFNVDIPIGHGTSYASKIPYSAENPWFFPFLRHLDYYQEIMKRYINMIYAIKFVRRLHSAEVEKFYPKTSSKTENADVSMTTEPLPSDLPPGFSGQVPPGQPPVPPASH